MKKIFILIFVLALFSCKKEKQEQPNKTVYALEYKVIFASDATNGEIHYKDENSVTQITSSKYGVTWKQIINASAGFEMYLKAAGIRSYSTNGSPNYTDCVIQILQNGNIVAEKSGFYFQELIYVVK